MFSTMDGTYNNWLDFEDVKCDFYSNVQEEKMPLREKNNSGKHVPHSVKPPQVVAKRNARERRRVQAVNNAFVRLRDAVPIENTRGKRISKVKTLIYAIDYIRTLDAILSECVSYNSSCCYEWTELHPSEGSRSHDNWSCAFKEDCSFAKIREY